MGLDHSRLGVEKNSWKTNQAEFLCVCQVYFTNSCQQIWGCVNQPFILFIHDLRWNSTYNLSYRPRTEHGISQFFNTNCTQSMFGTINRGLLAKLLKKNFQNHSLGPPVLVSSASCQCNWVFEWTLKELRLNIMTNL